MSETNSTENFTSDGKEVEYFPVSHLPNLLDPQTANIYADAIEQQGLSQVKAMDVAQEHENLRVMAEQWDRNRIKIEGELDAYLKLNEGEWDEFWSAHREKDRANYKEWQKASDEFLAVGGFMSGDEQALKKYTEALNTYGVRESRLSKERMDHYYNDPSYPENTEFLERVNTYTVYKRRIYDTDRCRQYNNPFFEK